MGLVSNLEPTDDSGSCLNAFDWCDPSTAARVQSFVSELQSLISSENEVSEFAGAIFPKRVLIVTGDKPVMGIDAPCEPEYVSEVLAGAEPAQGDKYSAEFIAEATHQVDLQLQLIAAAEVKAAQIIPLSSVPPSLLHQTCSTEHSRGSGSANTRQHPVRVTSGPPAVKRTGVSRSAGGERAVSVSRRRRSRPSQVTTSRGALMRNADFLVVGKGFGDTG